MSRNLVYDLFNDDLTMRNYLALMVCILNTNIKQHDAI